MGRHLKNATPWTEDEWQRALSLRSSGSRGMGYRRIGKFIGRTEQDVGRQFAHRRERERLPPCDDAPSITMRRVRSSEYRFRKHEGAGA